MMYRLFRCIYSYEAELFMSSCSYCMLFDSVRRFCDAKGNDNYRGSKQQLYSHAHENEAKLLNRMKVNIFYSLVVPVGRKWAAFMMPSHRNSSGTNIPHRNAIPSDTVFANMFSISLFEVILLIKKANASETSM